MKSLILSLMIIFIYRNVNAELNFQNKTMKMVYFHDYEPFSWKDQNGKMKGILIDVVNKVLSEKMGINLDHKGYPWARAQYLVKMGRADAFVTVPTPERKEYTVISKKPAINVAFTMFINTNHHKINDLKNIYHLENLKEYKHISYVGDGWAKKMLKGMNVSWEPSMKHVLKLISTNKEYIFIDTSPVVQYNIKKYQFNDKIIEIKNPLDKTSFNLCIGKKSPFKSIIKGFDETIEKVKKSGELSAVYNKYK